MSYIRKLTNGKYRAEISKNYTSIQSKTCPIERKAEEWADYLWFLLDKTVSGRGRPKGAMSS